MMEIKSDTRSTPISDGDFGVYCSTKKSHSHQTKQIKTVNKFMK